MTINYKKALALVVSLLLFGLIYIYAGYEVTVITILVHMLHDNLLPISFEDEVAKTSPKKKESQ